MLFLLTITVVAVGGAAGVCLGLIVAGWQDRRDDRNELDDESTNKSGDQLNER